MQALLTILSIIIGLVFVLLLFSLLTSTVMEIIAGALSLRGKHLLFTLRNMLGGKTDDFLGHPFFRQLSYAAHHRRDLTDYKLPAWISKQTFSSVLLDILEGDAQTNILQKIDSLPNNDLKKLLLYLYRQCDGTAAGFRARIEEWFEEVMDRASDWYKRSIKWWLFFVGFGLAAVFNADTIQIYKSLSANSTLRQDFLALAEKTVEKTDSVRSMDLKKSLPQATDEFQDLAKTYKEVVSSPLGLGWTESQGGGNLPFWLIKFLGFLLTGIAVTFGAPFWFEVLKKLIAVNKAAGGAVATTTTATVQTVPSGSASTAVAVISGKKEEDVFEGFRNVAPPPMADEEPPPASKPKSKPKSRRRKKPRTESPIPENPSN